MGLAFDRGHAINGIGLRMTNPELGDDTETLEDLVQHGGLWGDSPYEPGLNLDQEVVEFGSISGVIYLYDDGTASATASWGLENLHSPAIYGGFYDVFGDFPGHGVLCRPGPAGEIPATRVLAWDLPVTVGMTPVEVGQQSNLDGLPEVEMTFSFGRERHPRNTRRTPRADHGPRHLGPVPGADPGSDPWIRRGRRAQGPTGPGRRGVL
jgi:hypothetical protein